MARKIARTRRGSLIAGFVVVALLAVWTAVRAVSTPPAAPRKISLVASATAFNNTNPVLRAVAGADVEVILENRDTTAHHFVILGIEGTDSGLVGPGETKVVRFRPTTPGRFRYTCVLHLNMMSGEFIVEKR